MSSEATKQCSKCREIKPLNMFGIRSSSKDRHRCQCKNCEHKSNNVYSESLIGRKKRREWRTSDRGKECARSSSAKYRGTATGREVRRSCNNRWLDTTRGRLTKKAQNAVWNAVKSGRMQKASEQKCEDGPEGCRGSHEYHHDSYLEVDWLSVRPLCKAHHETWHVVNLARFPVEDIESSTQVGGQ